MKTLETAMRRTNRNVARVTGASIGDSTSLVEYTTYRGQTRYAFIQFTEDGHPAISFAHKSLGDSFFAILKELVHEG